MSGQAYKGPIPAGDRSARQAPARSPADYVMAIYRAATDDAVAVAEHLTLASRAAAVSRFEEVWPSVSGRSISTRRLLRDWYLHVYQQHLDRGLGAPADSPIDGNRAEQLFLDIPRTSGAPTEVAIDTVLALARDARAFAARVGAAQERFVSAAVAGRIATVFPRHPGAPVTARQAIGEQLYLRAFRAELDPVLFHLATPSLGQAEIAQAIDDLTVGSQAGCTGGPIRSLVADSTADRRQQASLAWNTLPDHRRLLWLTRHGLDERLFRRPWNKLPTPVHETLLAETSKPATQAQPAGDRTNVTLGGPVESAAARFGGTVVRPAGPPELAAARVLFHRGGVALPPRLVSGDSLEPVKAALARLKEASSKPAQTRGLRRPGWWNDEEKLNQAARLRMEGADWARIGREIGVPADRARSGLIRYGDLDPVFTQPRPKRLWTPEELETAAALRAQGHRWNVIAAIVGRSSGPAVRQAVQAAHRRDELPDDPTVRRGPTRCQPPSLGL